MAKIALVEINPRLKGKFVIETSGQYVKQPAVIDNYQFGFDSVEEARSSLESIMNEDINLHHETAESAIELAKELAWEKDEPFDGRIPDWYKGPGYYNCDNNELLYPEGTMYYDAGDEYFSIAKAEEVEVEEKYAFHYQPLGEEYETAKNQTASKYSTTTQKALAELQKHQEEGVKKQTQNTMKII